MTNLGKSSCINNVPTHVQHMTLPAASNYHMTITPEELLVFSKLQFFMNSLIFVNFYFL